MFNVIVSHYTQRADHISVSITFSFTALFIVLALVYSDVQGHYAVILLRHESILENYSAPNSNGQLLQCCT